MDYGLSGLLPGDSGITQTVQKMVTAVKFTLEKYDIRSRAELIIATCAERDENCEVGSIFTWVKNHFHYVRDPAAVELVKSPDVVDQEINARGSFSGDCDDVSAYLAALLVSIGYHVSFFVINLPGQGDDFRHIYPKVYISSLGRWLAIDACARYQPIGWEAPNGGRYKEYPVQ